MARTTDREERAALSMTTSTNAREHLQALGAPSFRLWIHLCRKAQTEGEEEFVVSSRVRGVRASVRYGPRCDASSLRNT